MGDPSWQLPTPSPRVYPGGVQLPNGFSTKIVLSALPAADFFEQTVMAPGYDGGDAIAQTTMLNVAWRTFRPRNLKTLTPITVKAAYDPGFFENCSGHAAITQVINVEQTITVAYPEGTTIAFFGYVGKVEPEANEEGKLPLLTLTITPTNWDYQGNVEAGPTVSSTHGT